MNADIKTREYTTVSEVSGPLMIVEGVEGVAYNEIVEIETPAGEARSGQVLEVKDDIAVVQVFEGTTDLNTRDTKARFTGETAKIGVSKDMMGRIFNGTGKPIDGGPEIIPDVELDINGNPMNPASREFPAEFIQTGISTIDGMNTLVRGQKLPIFSGSGLPHNDLAAQIARQAKVVGSDDEFAVIFGAMGITHEEANFFMRDFERTGALEKVTVFIFVIFYFNLYSYSVCKVNENTRHEQYNCVKKLVTYKSLILRAGGAYTSPLLGRGKGEVVICPLIVLFVILLFWGEKFRFFGRREAKERAE